MNKEEREIIKEAIEILRKNNEDRIAQSIRKEDVITTVLFGIIPYVISYYFVITYSTFTNFPLILMYLFAAILALLPCTLMFSLLFFIYKIFASPTIGSVLFKKRLDLWNSETKQSISYLSSVL